MGKRYNKQKQITLTVTDASGTITQTNRTSRRLQVLNMKYLAIVLLSCLVSSCGVQQVKAIEGEMPFTQGTPTKELLNEMPALIGMPDRRRWQPSKDYSCGI